MKVLSGEITVSRFHQRQFRYCIEVPFLATYQCCRPALCLYLPDKLLYLSQRSCDKFDQNKTVSVLFTYSCLNFGELTHAPLSKFNSRRRMKISPSSHVKEKNPLIRLIPFVMTKNSIKSYYFNIQPIPDEFQNFIHPPSNLYFGGPLGAAS